MLRYFIPASRYLSISLSFIVLFLRLCIAAWVYRTLLSSLHRSHVLQFSQFIPLSLRRFTRLFLRYFQFFSSFLRSPVSWLLNFSVSSSACSLDPSLYHLFNYTSFCNSFRCFQFFSIFYSSPLLVAHKFYLLIELTLNRDSGILSYYTSVTLSFRLYILTTLSTSVHRLCVPQFFYSSVWWSWNSSGAPSPHSFVFWFVFCNVLPSIYFPSPIALFPSDHLLLRFLVLPFLHLIVPSSHLLFFSPSFRRFISLSFYVSVSPSLLLSFLSIFHLVVPLSLHPSVSPSLCFSVQNSFVSLFLRSCFHSCLRFFIASLVCCSVHHIIVFNCTTSSSHVTSLTLM